MTRFSTRLCRIACAAVAACWSISDSPSLANSAYWKTAASGVWSVGSNWNEGIPPVGGQAAFAETGAYTVTFNSDPQAIKHLYLDAGHVTFTSNSFLLPSTLRAIAGASDSDWNDADVLGASLTLGTSGGIFSPDRPLHLTLGDTLRVENGGALNVGFGSDLISKRAEIFSGVVNVNGSGSTWTNSDTLDLYGTALTVQNGGSLLNSTSYVGAAVTITGAGSTWSNSGELQVERGGTLTIQAGGNVSSVNTNSYLGRSSDSNGTATITGTGSTWSNGWIAIGDYGRGELTIEAGGSMTSNFGYLGRIAFSGINSTGTATVTGAGSNWTLSQDLSVGDGGTGNLTIAGGGSVTSTHGVIGRFVGSSGAVGVAGTGSTWIINGGLSIGGNPLTNLNGGQGSLSIGVGGTVSAAQGVVLFPGSIVQLDGGTFAAQAIRFQGGGQIFWNSGRISVGVFHGNLGNYNHGVLAPGNSVGSTTVMGFYEQHGTGTLEIEIGGTAQATQYDVVHVTGQALLDGTLALKLIDGFLPNPSQTFFVLSANSVSGGFDNAANGQRLATSDGGGSFLVSYGVGSAFDPTLLVLSNFQVGGLLGDYNNNGTVDAADYVVWRNNLGSGTALPNDDSPGVGLDDYSRWRSHFGQTAGSGSSTVANTAVPEPSTLVILVLATAGVCLRRRRAA